MRRSFPRSSHAHYQKYLYKLVEIFAECEDLEDLDGLHRLSSIMKTLSEISFRNN
jgi:hypothetical protein